MDYMERKLSQRLVLDTGPHNGKAEEHLFYQSYGASPLRIWHVVAKLVIWVRSQDWRPRLPPQLTQRKAQG